MNKILRDFLISLFKILFKLTTVLVLVWVGVMIYYYSLPKSRGPENRAELCRAIGRKPTRDPLCKPGNLNQLLDKSFLVGVATRDQVRDALGTYLESSSPRLIGGVIDS